jgi:phosphoribosylaminoimidazolecarboxamide formyltransferase / IMP cyclohydrolase
MIKVKRALLSVSDKTGLLDLARGLQRLGVEIISTGGTAQALKQAGISVQEISDYTGFPEILDGRVKTLHPAVHGGLLALRDKAEHMAQLEKFKIGLIDMVVVNLYPFEKVIQKRNVTLEEAIENIDIGGPSMLRSAAKNFKSVAVICNPKRYPEILKELENNQGLLSVTVLNNLAVEVFQYTSQYDCLIYDFLNRRFKSSELANLPRQIVFQLNKIQDLRYGENPHQRGAFYTEGTQRSGLANLQQLNGKELSFNNLLDLQAAIDVVKEFTRAAAVVIKHNNPTGVAEADSLSAAYQQAWASDKVSAFGGIIGFNQVVDLKTARLIEQSGFMECLIAPGYANDALKLLSQKKNLRIIKLPLADFGGEAFDFKRVNGGVLLQDKDTKSIAAGDLNVVTKLKPTPAQIDAMLFGWRVVKHVRSNAIILVKGTRTVGIGCGQTSRVESVRNAIQKAGKNVRQAILVSDAFIPMTDNVKIAAQAGIKVIIQSGGSIADEDVIRQANRLKMVMVMTGVRHFKH